MVLLLRTFHSYHHIEKIWIYRKPYSRVQPWNIAPGNNWHEDERGGEGLPYFNTFQNPGYFYKGIISCKLEQICNIPHPSSGVFHIELFYRGRISFSTEQLLFFQTRMNIPSTDVLHSPSSYKSTQVPPSICPSA